MTACRETVNTAQPRSPSAGGGDPVLGWVVLKHRGHQLNCTPGSACFPGLLEKLMKTLVMSTGLVSGVYKDTWSVSKRRKIPVLMLGVEILLSNATNRPGDLWYIKDITWSCLCPVLHSLGRAPGWGTERRQSSCTLPTGHLLQWPYGARQSHASAHGWASCGGIQCICRPLQQHQQMQESHAPPGLLAAMELVPNLREALCFSEPLFFPTPLL